MYCSSCGAEVPDGGFCSKCGARINNNDQPVQQQPDYQQPQPGYQPPAQPYYQQQPDYQQPQPGYQPPAQPYYQQQQNYQQAQPGYQPPLQPYTYRQNEAAAPSTPGSFTVRMHQYSSSALFLVGIILFSAGNLISQIMSINILSIYTLILAALPVIGFWLAYAAARKPRLPEKTLPALTLFKTSVIIGLVVLCLFMLVMFIVVIALMIGAGMSSQIDLFGGIFSGVMVAVGIILLIILAGAIIIIVFYYRSVFRIISGIQNGIRNNIIYPLRSIKFFSVLTYIGAVFSVLSAVFSFGSMRVFNEAIYSLPSEFSGFIEPIAGTLTGHGALSAILTIIGSVGTVLCVMVLNRFNNSLMYDR